MRPTHGNCEGKHHSRTLGRGLLHAHDSRASAKVVAHLQGFFGIACAVALLVSATPLLGQQPIADDMQLPSLLTTPDGQTIRTAMQWEDSRDALLDLFRKHIYGTAPGRPDTLKFELTNVNTKAMDGKATLKEIRITCGHAGRTAAFPMVLFVPNDRPEPAAVLLLINNRQATNTDPTREHRSDFWPAERVIERGYAIAAIETNSIAPDLPERWRDGVVGLYDEPRWRAEDAWGAIAAWAWGASRAMDYIETDSELNARRVAVLGHSRGGKAALWAGATDERFAMVVSNCSGCTGAALARRCKGETIRQINRKFPYWFDANYKQYNGNEAALPIDQHQLIALIAPRAVYVGSAAEDDWADPEGEFLAAAEASGAYRLYGNDEGLAKDAMPPVGQGVYTRHMGYHLAEGGHGLGLWAWDRYMDFADRLWPPHASGDPK